MSVHVYIPIIECICVFMSNAYACIVYTDVYIYVHTCERMCMRIYTHLCVYVCMHICVCVIVDTCAYLYVGAYICINK